MAERISLAALRETAEVVWEADGSEADGKIDRAVVLALVEAVEAARAVAASPETDGDSLLLSDLDIALARFEFKDARG